MISVRIYSIYAIENMHRNDSLIGVFRLIRLTQNVSVIAYEYSVLYSTTPIHSGTVYLNGGIQMERPLGVNLIYAAGGDPLCTLHRGKGLYG